MFDRVFTVMCRVYVAVTHNALHLGQRFSVGLHVLAVSRHSSIKARFVQCTANICPVDELRISAAHPAVLSAAPLMSALPVWPVSLGGRPCLGRFSVVPCSFHFTVAP